MIDRALKVQSIQRPEKLKKGTKYFFLYRCAAAVTVAPSRIARTEK